jgi:hypothetical protein
MVALEQTDRIGHLILLDRVDLGGNRTILFASSGHRFILSHRPLKI